MGDVFGNVSPKVGVSSVPMLVALKLIAVLDMLAAMGLSGPNEVGMPAIPGTDTVIGLGIA